MSILDTLRGKSTVTASGCWELNLAPNRDGYKQIRINGTKQYAHRLAVGAQKGEIVMHHCDNPGCCNPEHLSIATQKENVRDMFNKGRSNRQKLTDAIAITIRKSVEKNRVLAERYGVSEQLICNIKKGRAYVHLQ
ncbi:hypothetical protein [Klebsiella phage 175007]|uniref:HNH nuclease domain-containing protein n=1 Tax=Klebsiella phage 175007 TaxID=3127743 RepID=A0ABZ2IDB0_9CAUD